MNRLGTLMAQKESGLMLLIWLRVVQIGFIYAFDDSQ